MYIEMIIDGILTKVHLESTTEGILLSTNRLLMKIDWQNLYQMTQLPSVQEELAMVELNPKASPL